MGKIILICLLTLNLSIGQTIDFEEAPRNPVGFKWKKEHFNLKGDIYSSDAKIFNPDGTLFENYGTIYYYKNGLITGNNYGDSFKLDDQGNVISFTYVSGSTTEYRFDSRNRLTYEKNSSGDAKTYSYDDRDRLIETKVERNGALYQIRKLSYSKQGKDVIVDVVHNDSSGNQNFKATYVYRNGMLIKEIVSSGTYEYEVILDKKGNKKIFKSKEPGSKEYITFNRYYDERDSNLKIELGYYKTSEKSKKILAAYINGNKANAINIAKGIKPDEKVVYDGLTRTYYSVPDFKEDTHNDDTRIPVNKILSKGAPFISYAYNKKFINYVNGVNRVKSRDFTYLGPHMIDYRVDKNLGRVYLVENYKNDSNEVKTMQLLSVDPDAVHYLRDQDSENFFVVTKGKHIDYKKATFEYLSSGDPLISIDDKPLYVLTGFREAVKNRIYQARAYNEEQDKDQIKSDAPITKTSNVPSSTSAEVVKNESCVSGNCKNGWGEMKMGDAKVKAMFRDGVINGIAIIDYPGNSYYHGEYKNNQREGTGYYRGADGDHYVGEWKNGKRNGYGYIMNSKNKIYQAGYFENDKLVRTLDAEYIANKQSAGCIGDCKNGFGYILYSNGDKYWGFFKNGQRHHIGYYIWNNGSVYVGNWVDGVRTGYGAYTYVDKSKFKGIFNQNKIDGPGQMTYAKTGNVVEGIFDNSGKKVRDF